MKTCWRWFLCIGILGSIGLLDRGAAVAQDLDPQVEKVFADWKKRQGLAKSVLYRVRGEMIVPKGSWPNGIGIPSGDVPARDIACQAKRTFLLDFPTNRYRLEIEEEQYDKGTEKLYPLVQTRIFDGTLIKSYRPRDRNTHPVDGVGPLDAELGIGKGHFAKKAALEMVHWPMFVGHGSLPSHLEPALPGKLTVLPDIDMIYVHGRGTHQGRPCLVLRTHRQGQSFEEFWVDTARDSAIVRMVWYLTDKPCTDTEIEYDNIVRRWLPNRWTFTMYTNSGQVLHVERMRVEAVTLDLPVGDADFQIEERPGMLVAHLTHEAPAEPGEYPPEAKSQLYHVEEGGKLQEVVVKDGVLQAAHSYHWWWGLLALLPAIGLLIWFLRRRSVPRGSASG